MYKFGLFTVSGFLGWLAMGEIGMPLGIMAGGFGWLALRSTIWSTVDLLASWSVHQPIASHAATGLPQPSRIPTRQPSVPSLDVCEATLLKSQA
jgi:hypothetical protein